MYTAGLDDGLNADDAVSFHFIFDAGIFENDPVAAQELDGVSVAVFDADIIDMQEIIPVRLRMRRLVLMFN
jgi:hypothetical protein